MQIRSDQIIVHTTKIVCKVFTSRTDEIVEQISQPTWDTPFSTVGHLTKLKVSSEISDHFTDHTDHFHGSAAYIQVSTGLIYKIGTVCTGTCFRR